MSYTTTEFLLDLKRIMFLPTGQRTFEDADLLSIATDQQRGLFTSLVKRLRTGLFTVKKEFDLDGSGQQKFKLPKKSIGATLSSAYFTKSGSTCLEPLVMDKSPLGTNTSLGLHTGRFANNYLVITSAPTTYEKLVIEYYARPSVLVEEIKCAQITDILSNGMQLSDMPAGITDLVDVVSANSPYGFLAVEVGGSVNVDVFECVVPEDVSLGDWVCPEGQTCLLQFPEDLASAIKYRTAAVALRIAGFLQAAEALDKEADKLISSMMDILTPKADLQPEMLRSTSPFVSQNRYGRRFPR